MFRLNGGLGIKMLYLQFSNKSYKGKKIIQYIGDDPPIDPEETKKILTRYVEKTKEFRIQQKLIESKADVNAKQYAIYRQYNAKMHPKTRKFLGTKSEESELKSEFLQNKKELENIELEIIKHAKIMDEIRASLLKEYAIYSAPRNAKLILEKDAKPWIANFNNLKKDEFLLDDNTIITSNDLELDRISNLSGSGRLFEKNRAIERKISEALRMRNQLEVQGDLKALEKSQEWLRKEKEIIEQRYSE